jgi:hypothetical protein
MFNLNTASEGIRKAAALQGIKSGKWEPVFDADNQPDTGIIARVYNRNFPDGIEILGGDAENALAYTWREIDDAKKGSPITPTWDETIDEITSGKTESGTAYVKGSNWCIVLA